jgi:alkaline phosphatase D
VKPESKSLLSSVDRRRFMLLTGQGMAAAMAYALLPGDDLSAAPSLGAYPFTLGVASGDPRPHGICIWTRLAPDPLAEDGRGGMPLRDVPVGWQIATDEGMTNIVASGTAQAILRLAHSVHVQVENLTPGRHYYYRFDYRGDQSPVGRTLTTPLWRAHVDRLRFVYACCQDWGSGFYSAYRHMAEEDIDLVFHLGDYIYDIPISSSGGNRKVDVPSWLQSQAETLKQYRLRYALYKCDPDLQEAHRLFPFSCIWDDHEVENDYGGPYLEDGNSSLQRRAAAYRAYYEHVPLWHFSRPRGSDMRIYRQIRFGNLISFDLLDTRQYRSGHPCGYGEGPRCAAAYSPETAMIGGRQMDWLLTRLAQAGPRWKVIVQQVLMAQFDHDVGPRQRFWLDAWDPYVQDRARLLGALAGVRNPIVLSGDWHSTFANDLKLNFDDQESPVVGAEFSAPALTSGGDDTPYGPYYTPMLPANPHVRYFDGDRRGYYRATVTPTEWQTDVRYVSSVADPEAGITTGASFIVEDGVAGISSISVNSPRPAAVSRTRRSRGRLAGI